MGNENHHLIRTQSTQALIQQADHSIAIVEKLLYPKVEILFNQAFVLLNSKKGIDESINYCRILQQDKHYHQKMKFKFEANHNEEYRHAVGLFSEALLINDNHSLSYCYRGIAECRLEDYARAIQDFGKAISIDPNFATAYNGRGGTKSYLKDYLGAIQDYDKAINIDPNYAYAYNNRGIAKRGLKDYTGAIQDYDKAISIDPNYAYAYNNRGIAKEKIGDMIGAKKDKDTYNQLTTKKIE